MGVNSTDDNDRNQRGLFGFRSVSDLNKHTPGRATLITLNDCKVIVEINTVVVYESYGDHL